VNLLEALVLGVVQGFTEFLPISSTAHLRIVPHWLGWSDPGTEFSAVIQLGTLLSVLLYFREDVVRLTRAALRSLAARKLFATQDSRLAWSIAVGTLPVVATGQLHRVAGITQVHEVDALDHPARVDVQTGDHPDRPHPADPAMAATAAARSTVPS